MKKYLLPEQGSFYKANLHCHTDLSDGRKTPAEVKEIYKSLGYSVVAYTDHDVMIPHPELCDENFLALNAFEAEINEPKEVSERRSRKTCHICFIALDPDNVTQPCWNRDKYFFGNAKISKELVKFDENEPDYVRVYSSAGISNFMKKVREKGFFVTYNHPSWSIEDYSNYMGYEGMHAFEMFNGSCNVAGFEDYNPRVYDDMLRGGKRIYCIGADDNHNKHPVGSRRCDSGAAFTVIKAKSLAYRDVTDALLAGSFYASEGPEIKELYFEEGKVTIKCSAADRVLLSCGTRANQIAYGEESTPLTEACFTLSPDCMYFRLTVVDEKGRHACTNAYFMDELLNKG